jgi:hypothetical protein
MEHSAEIVLVTVLGLCLIILFVFGVIACRKPKKKEGDIVSWKEYKENTKNP